MKSGGGSGSAPIMPQPRGAVTPYGQASTFNPQYQSVLPVGPEGQTLQTQTAQLTDPIRNELGNRTPLLEQQEAAPTVAAQPNQMDMMKMLLAKLMAGKSQPYLGGRGGERGSGGGSAQGGSGGFGGSSARGGGLY